MSEGNYWWADRSSVAVCYWNILYSLCL